MKKFLIFSTILFSFLFYDNIKAQTITTDFGNVEVNSYFTYYNSNGGGPYYQTLSNYIVANNVGNTGVVLINNPSLSFSSFNNFSITLGIQTTNFYSYNFSTQRWVVQTNSSFSNKIYYSTLDYINSYNSSTKVLTLHKLEDNSFNSDSITLNTYSTFNNNYNGVTRYNYAYTYDTHIFITNSSGNSSIYIQNAYKNCDYFLALNYNVSQNYTSEARYCSSQPYSVVNGYLYTPNNTSTGINLGNNASTYNNYYLSNYNLSFTNGTLNSNFNIAPPVTPTPPSFLFLLNDNRDEFNRLISIDIRLNISDYSEDFIIQYITGDTTGTWTTILPEYNELTGYYFTWDEWSYNTTIFVRSIYVGNNEVLSSASQEITGIIPSYDSGQVNNYGNNSFGVTSKQVTITGENLFNNITCSSQRAFVDNVCYVNDSDILDIQDKLDNKVHVRFNFSMHNISVPYQGDKYYLFGYRSYFDRVLLPFNISIISGNLINSTATIIDYNVKEHGLYRDYIILFSSSSSQGLVSVDGVNLDFPEFSTIYDTFPQPFTLGFYNGVKYQQFDTIPTLSQIDNFYNNNTLDSLNNSSLLSYFSNFSVNDHGLSSVVLKPIDFLNYLTSSTCTPVEIPFPHSNQVITLPCISSLFQTHLPSVFQLYQVIVSGLIFYRIGIDLFRIIKNLFNPENDKIEVVDL